MALQPVSSDQLSKLSPDANLTDKENKTDMLNQRVQSAASGSGALSSPQSPIVKEWDSSRKASSISSPSDTSVAPVVKIWEASPSTSSSQNPPFSPEICITTSPSKFQQDDSYRGIFAELSKDCLRAPNIPSRDSHRGSLLLNEDGLDPLMTPPSCLLSDRPKFSPCSPITLQEIEEQLESCQNLQRYRDRHPLSLQDDSILSFQKVDGEILFRDSDSEKDDSRDRIEFLPIDFPELSENSTRSSITLKEIEEQLESCQNLQRYRDGHPLPFQDDSILSEQTEGTELPFAETDSEDESLDFLTPPTVKVWDLSKASSQSLLSPKPNFHPVSPIPKNLQHEFDASSQITMAEINENIERCRIVRSLNDNQPAFRYDSIYSSRKGSPEPLWVNDSVNDPHDSMDLLAIDLPSFHLSDIEISVRSDVSTDSSGNNSPVSTKSQDS